MKSNVKIILLAIMCSVVVFAIVVMLVYLVVSAVKPDTDNTANSAAQQIVNSAKDPTEDNKNETENSNNVTQSAEFTSLYMVDDGSDFYIVFPETEETLFDYPDGTVSGLYTGRVSDKYPDYIEIDYNDVTALVYSEDALPISGAKVLPAGVISQITSSGVGYSGCGPACLHMMLRNISLYETEANIPDYETLLYYAEDCGYADQGSLLTWDGGMSFDMLAALAKEVYGLEMVNAYDYSRKPSEVIKELIDSGKQAIVLVKHENGEIVDAGDLSHFILVTGYTEIDGNLHFIYANSYYTEDVDHGNPLLHVSADWLDISAGAQFSEPNSIIYIK